MRTTLLETLLLFSQADDERRLFFGIDPDDNCLLLKFIWVMPSSSARCAQLPRAMDKVPFYSGLKKFRDYLNGLIPEIDDSEVIFNDPKIRAADDGTEISEHLKGAFIFNRSLQISGF